VGDTFSLLSPLRRLSWRVVSLRAALSSSVVGTRSHLVTLFPYRLDQAKGGGPRFPPVVSYLLTLSFLCLLQIMC
jgi:hypothetical protein